MCQLAVSAIATSPQSTQPAPLPLCSAHHVLRVAQVVLAQPRQVERVTMPLQQLCRAPGKRCWWSELTVCTTGNGDRPPAIIPASFKMLPVAEGTHPCIIHLARWESAAAAWGRPCHRQRPPPAQTGSAAVYLSWHAAVQRSMQVHRTNSSPCSAIHNKHASHLLHLSCHTLRQVPPKVVMAGACRACCCRWQGCWPHGSGRWH